MFKFSVLLALVAPLVSALTVSPPAQAVTSAGSMTINWQVANGDPSSFSVYLSNPTFHNTFAVATNVEANTGSVTITIPPVPENQQYTVQLVQIDNVNNVLAETTPFTIGASTTTSSSTATSASATTASTRASGLVTSASSRVVSATSSFGTIVSNTLQSSATAPASSGRPSASAQSNSPSSSPSSALPVRFNMNSGLLASILLSAVAGAAVLVA